jgi:GT2 family glycosyltransferase
MDHISIVMVHFNSDKDTVECLESLSKTVTKGFKFNVLIVDNASKEPLGLPRTLSTQPFEVLRSESNLGFTGGTNLGITSALEKYNSDYILLLNNDTVVDPDFLLELYRHAQKHPQEGMICPKIYFYPKNEYHAQSYRPEDRGNVLWYAGGSIDWPNLVAFHRGVDEVDRGHFDLPTTSDFATGCCVLIRREVLEKIGLLDERFFLYLEDVDLSMRAINQGYEIGYAPTSKIWHKNAGSSGGAGSPLQQYYLTRNRLWFGLKHGTWRNRLTTAAYIFRLLRNGSNSEKTAAIDLLTGQMGKRVVI